MPNINTNSEAYKQGCEARLDGNDATNSASCPYVINKDTPLEKYAEMLQGRTDWMAGYFDSHYHESTDVIKEASQPVPQEVASIHSDQE